MVTRNMNNKKQSIFKRWALRKKQLQTVVEEAHEGDETISALEDMAREKIFQRQASACLDGLNEYDENYTAFIARGDLVTHEMQRAIDRLADKKSQGDDEIVRVTETAEDQLREKHDKSS
jgi:hypothetical protein